MAEPFVLNAVLNLQGFAAGSVEKIKGELNALGGAIGVNAAGTAKAATSAVKLPDFTAFTNGLAGATSALKALQTALSTFATTLASTKISAAVSPAPAKGVGASQWLGQATGNLQNLAAAKAANTGAGATTKGIAGAEKATLSLIAATEKFGVVAGKTWAQATQAVQTYLAAVKEVSAATGSIKAVKPPQPAATAPTAPTPAAPQAPAVVPPATVSAPKPPPSAPAPAAVQTYAYPFAPEGSYNPSSVAAPAAPIGGAWAKKQQDMAEQMAELKANSQAGTGFNPYAGTTPVIPKPGTAGFIGPQYPYPFALASTGPVPTVTPPAAYSPGNALKTQLGSQQYVAQQLAEIKQYAQSPLEAPIKKANAALDSIKTGQLNTLSKEMHAVGKAASTFGDSIALAAKRYAAFLVATTAAFKGLEAIKSGVSAALEFDAAMVKLDQTLDPTKSELNELKSRILDLSVSTGTSNKEVADIAITLAQAGKQGAELRESLDLLAHVPLAPAFESVGQATTALIAIQGQFKDKAGDTASIMDRLNELANKYAVTSTDLGEAVKRGGGTWAAMGGTLNEYLAIITAVRERTQESAESIGTAMRTISGFLGRTETLEHLKGLGVEVEDANGKMLNQYAILKRVAEVYKTLPDNQARKLVETLGGSRQAGRTTAILENFDLIEKAKSTAENSAGSFAQDVQKGMEGLSKQLDMLGNQFTSLAVKLSPELFEPFIQFLIKAGTLTTKLIDLLGPLLSMLSKVGAAALVLGGGALFKILGGKLGGLMGAQRVYTTAQEAGLTGSLIAGTLRQSGGGIGGTVLGGGLLEAAGLGALATKPVSQLVKGGDVKAAGASSIGQFALLGVFTSIVPALTQMGLEAAEVDESFAKLSARSLSAAATMVAVMSLLQGRSVGQTIKSPLGGLIRGDTGWGKALSLGATAGMYFGVIATQAYEVLQETIDQKLDQVAEQIKQIKVPETSEQANKALSELVADIDKGMDEAIEAASGLTGFLGGVGKRINNLVGGLLSGDVSRIGAAFNPNAPTIDGQEVIQKLVGQNLPALNGILEQMIRQNGTNFRQGFHQQIRDTLAAGNARPEEYARAIETEFFKKIGGGSGLNQVFDRIRESGIGLGSAAQSAREKLAALVPPSLLTNMMSLGRAVSEAVKAIDASIAAFDAQHGLVDTVTAPKLTTQVGKEEGGKILASGALKGMPGLTPDIQKQAEAYDKLHELALNFAESAGEVQRKADAERAAGKNPLPPLEGEGLKGTIDQFLEQNKVDEAIRPTLRLILVALAQRIVDGLKGNKALPTREEIEAEVKKQAPALAPAEGMGQIVAEQIGGTVRQMNKSLEVEASQLNRRVKNAKTPEQAFGISQEILQEEGLGSYRNPGEFDERLVEKMQTARVSAARRLAEVTNQIEQIMATGNVPAGVNLNQLFGEWVELSRRNMRLRAAQDAVIHSLENYDAAMDKSASDLKEMSKAREEIEATDKVLAELERRGGMAYAQGQMVGAIRGNNAEVAGILANLEKAQSPEDIKALRQQYQEAEIRRLESMQRLKDYYASRGQMGMDDRPADSAQAHVSQRLGEDMQASEDYRRRAFDAKVDLKNEREKERMANLAQALERIDAVVEKTIANVAGLNDPFGSKTFATAVEKFDQVVTRLSTQESPAKPGEKFVNGYAVPERFTPLQTQGLEQAFYGADRGTVLQTANEILADPNRNPFVSSRWVSDGIGSMYRGTGHYEKQIDVGSTRDLFSLDNANQLEERSKKLAPLIEKSLADSGHSIAPGTGQRIAQLLMARGNLGNDQIKVDDRLKGYYEQAVRQLELTAELKAVQADNTAAVKENTAAIKAVTGQPATQPSVSIAPSITGQPTGPLPGRWTDAGGGFMQGTMTPKEAAGVGSLNMASGTGVIIGSDGAALYYGEKAGSGPPQLRPRISPEDMGRGGSSLSPQPNEVKTAPQGQTDAAVNAINRLADALASTAKAAGQGTRGGSQAAGTTDKATDQITASLEKTVQAIQKGVDVKVESIQNLNVDIKGLDDAIERELKPAIEEAASRVAKEIVRRTLVDLANASDAEGANVFRSATRGLA